MSDKTYSETLGIPAFDWWKALDNPRHFLPGELSAKASKWTFCACGNQCAIIPRFHSGSPEDGLLFLLGTDFCEAVYREAWDDAKSLLAQIEARSAILIAEELAKLNAEPLHA